MKGTVPNVRKAKAIHEIKQAERNATANKMEERTATTRCGRRPNRGILILRPTPAGVRVTSGFARRSRLLPAACGPIPTTARAYPRR